MEKYKMIWEVLINRIKYYMFIICPDFLIQFQKIRLSMFS